MKATLEFTLPDEQHEFDAAVRGLDYKNRIEEVVEDIRKAIKYGHQFDSANAALEGVLKLLNEDY